MAGGFICGRAGPLTPAARQELDDFEAWLMLPRPRPEFRAWRSVTRGNPAPIPSPTREDHNP